MPNVHSTKPKAVRLPDGLEVRVKEALADGETVNAFIVAAIEERLARREGGSTTRARKPAADTAPPAQFRQPESADDIAAFFRNRKTGGK